MRKFLFLVLATTISSPLVAQKSESPEQLFGSRQGVIDISLSPDGKQIVYITPGAGRTSEVYHVSLTEKKPKLITRSSGEPDRVLSCNFVSNSRIACTVYGVGNVGGVNLSYSEQIALGVDGQDMQRLGQKRSFYGNSLRQHDGYILNWLPDSDDVLMAWQFVPEINAGSKINRTADGLGVVRLDTKTGRWKGVESAKGTASDFFTDGQGAIRVLGFDDPGVDGNQTTITRYSYREQGGKRLNDLSAYDFSDRSGFRPLAVDGPKNVVYGLELRDGREALYSVSLDGNMTKKLVYAHPRVDVSGVKQFGARQRVVGVRYTDEYSHIEYFDKSIEALSGQLSKALPGEPNLQFLDSSEDENILLMYAGSDRDPGRYYLFDRNLKRLEEIMLERPELEGVMLSTVKPITYKTADGTNIPGYLTLPPDRKAKNLPAIVMPHGGPSSRDVWGFDWLAQYFANQGYAVLQPNFRGSSGYGQKWFQVNGFRQWETAIGDVTAGANWMISEGIANPEKLAIVGWSYGGYAALQSGVAEPDLYQAIVAIAPVTDLRTLIDDSRQYTSFSNVLRYVGSGPHLLNGSPAKNADKIKAPVLMFHGDMDINVDIGHARKMNSALEASGKPVKLYTYKGLDHGLPDSSVRMQMLKKMKEFLSMHLAN